MGFSSISVKTESHTASNSILTLNSLGWKNPTPIRNAVMIDFLSYGLTTLIVQFGDNFMFFWRFLAVVPKTSRLKKAVIYAYIIVIITLLWVPTYTIVPFFYDTNSVSFNNVYYWTLEIQIYGNLAYNFYFSVEFGHILYKIYFDPTFKYSNQVYNISVKSIIHFAIRYI